MVELTLLHTSGTLKRATISTKPELEKKVMNPDVKKKLGWEGEKSPNPLVIGNHASVCISNMVLGVLLYVICVVQEIPGQEIYAK